MIFFSMGGCTLGKFNSMGGGHMNLSEYMGGRGLWKFNSMGGGVEKKVPSSPPPGIFFWNSPHLRHFFCNNFKVITEVYRCQKIKDFNGKQNCLCVK